MNSFPIIIAGSVIAVAAIGAIYLLRLMATDKRLKFAEKTRQESVEKAINQANDIVNKAHTEGQRIISKLRQEVEEENKIRRKSVNEIEQQALQKEKHLQQKEKQFLEKEAFLEKEVEKLKVLRKKEEQLLEELSGKIEKIAGLSKEEAEKTLMASIERDCRHRAGKLIKDIEDQAKKIANRRAKEIVTDAIQRTAVDHVAAATTSVVQLPDDDMKGRVIGREGRNIRAFEAATGVDVIIDDTPGAIVLSAFDPLRREIAKMALSQLLEDGRIHPTRVEEAVDAAKKELKNIIIERGERAADELGLQFHPAIIEMLGKLHYRTSYGQNMLKHSLESAHLAGIMANTLGVNVNLSKRGAVLHDIGKAIDFEQEGSHTDLGKEICEKYGESEEVINCIMAHHEDEEPDTIEAIIVMMADAISSVRPGARREATESYIKRLEKLESLANSYKGVDKAYAIQAGREIRVIVRPDEIDDASAKKLAYDMAKKIENELDYPGEIRVNIVRETRAFGVAH